MSGEAHAEDSVDAFHRGVLDRIMKLAGEPASPKAALEAVLRLAAKHRAHLLKNTLLKVHGERVLGGPFAGMAFVRDVAEGCAVPKLLGCYEAELHPFVEHVVAQGYPKIVNIGVAEGYYAVGLARRMPETLVYAFDIDETAQRTCAAVAARNGVGDRVRVGGLFRGEDFAAFAGDRTLVVCDIEGAERQLLDPASYPALKSLDLLVELHDCIDPTISRTIVERFSTTHEVTIVREGGRDWPLPPVFQRLGHLDRLLAVWEWRTGPTPWAILRARRS